jgi:Arc/MetJ-type ribon-helix-helix transcriptional regulator
MPRSDVTLIDTRIQHTSKAEAESTPEKTTVNIRMTETFLDDVDATWESQGFNSRSEYIRAVLRDALKHPDFNRADLKAMLAGEVEIKEGRTHSSDAIKAMVGDDSGSDGDE